MTQDWFLWWGRWRSPLVLLQSHRRCRCQSFHHILANRGRSLKKRPLHIPTSWLWKINPNHSSNLVPSERLSLIPNMAAGPRRPPLAGGRALELGGVLRFAQLWAHFLFTYSPSSFSDGPSGCEGQVRRLPRRPDVWERLHRAAGVPVRL